MKRRHIIIGTIAFILMAKLCFALGSPFDSKNNDQPAPIPVKVAKVHQQSLPIQVQSVGNLVAVQKGVISSEVSGRVAKIYYQDGQFVAKSMPIIQLDDTTAKADLASAKAALNLSQTTFNRYQQVFKEGGTSKQQLDQLRSDMESKQAAVKNAQVELQQKTLVAPFDGNLNEIKIVVGDYVDQGQVLVSIINKRALKVQYTIPQQFLPQLQMGQNVNVTSSAYKDQVFTGKVSYISPAVDKDTGTVAVQATIPNKQELLSPGMFVTVTQQLGVDKKALMIPEEGVMASLQGYHVFRVVKGKAVQTKVTLGVHKDGMVQVINGLQLDDTVVIAGQQKLEDGSVVTILNKSSALKNN